MNRSTLNEFARAERAVDKTAARIVAEIQKLLGKPWEAVARDALVECLLLALADDLVAIINPPPEWESLPRPAIVKLSNALLDYRDSRLPILAGKPAGRRRGPERR